MTETTTTAAAPEIAYIITGDPLKPTSRVSFVLNSRWRSYALASEQGRKLVELLTSKPQDIEQIAELSDIPTWIAKQTHGRVTVDECERLRLDGKLIDYGLTGRITKIVEQGASFAALANFIENVSENPNQDVAEDLYRFLEKGDIPITPDGMILVFKRVDRDYRSFWSGAEDVTVRYPDDRTEIVKGRIPHPVGGEIAMPRELCDPKRTKVCSVGIHGCSFEYLRSYHGGKGLIVIGNIDPRDVTAIPSDANDTKLRCCRMKIVGEISEADAREHFKDVVDARYPPVIEEPVVAEDDAAELAETVDEAGRTHLKLLPIDEDNDDAMAPGRWSARGYEDGREAGVEDRANDYDYKPDFAVPPEIIDHEVARAAYSKGFVEAYDAAFRASPASAAWEETEASDD